MSKHSDNYPVMAGSL